VKEHSIRYLRCGTLQLKPIVNSDCWLKLIVFVYGCSAVYVNLAVGNF